VCTLHTLFMVQAGRRIECVATYNIYAAKSVYVGKSLGPLAPFGYLCIHTDVYICICIHIYVYTYVYVYVYIGM